MDEFRQPVAARRRTATSPLAQEDYRRARRDWSRHDRVARSQPVAAVVDPRDVPTTTPPAEQRRCPRTHDPAPRDATAGRSAVTAMMCIPVEDRAVLDFATRWARHGGGPSEQIREQFGMNDDEFFTHLIDLLDNPATQTLPPARTAELQAVARRRLWLRRR